MALGDPTILERTLSVGERAVLAALARRVRERFGEAVLAISVFGSRARGDVEEDSDIDVLVVLDVPAAAEAAATDVVWEAVAEAKREQPSVYVPLAPVILSRVRFDRLLGKETRFARDVTREGISL